MQASDDRTARNLGWLVVGLAVVLQWGWALWSPTQPISDFQRYYEVASEFAATGELSHQGRPYIFQPPAWPFTLGCLFKLTGPSVLAGKLLNALLGSLAVAMLWSLLLRLARPGWLRVVAFAPVALCPLWIGYTSVLGTECLSAFLMVTTVWTMIFAPGRWLVSGLCLGLLVLNRPQYQLLIPALLLWSLWHGRGMFWRVLLWSLVAAAVVAPWTLRNLRVTGSFVTVAGYSGYVLLVNNNGGNPETGWMPLSDIELTAADRERFEAVGAGDLFRPGDEDAKTFRWTPAVDAIASSIAVRWILANPGEFLRKAAVRLWRMYGDSVEMTTWITRGTEWPAPVLHYRRAIGWLAFAAAVFGMLRLLRRDTHPALIVTVAMYGLGIATAAVFEGQGRYALPTWPLVALLAVGARPRAAASPSPVLQEP
ncbi:MAG: glycosyltransferase family 39 protein [Planctomycetes bacterium]|nr:glycosyltransferase family 39 protein [Planctomycetota bacterium]